MAGILRIMTKEEERVINRLLEGEGIVLITEDAAKQTAGELEISAEELNERYMPSYDYGGEADKWVDVVRTTNHICLDYLKNEINH